jgi:hypothetical protein
VSILALATDFFEKQAFPNLEAVDEMVHFGSTDPTL